MNRRLFTLMLMLAVAGGCSNEQHRAESFVNAGTESVQRGDLDGAIDNFDRAIELNPQNAYAYYCRGTVKIRLEDWDGAVVDFTHSIQLNPKNGTAYFFRGNARLQRNDPNGALADYTRAIDCDPRLAQAYLYRGLVEMQMSNWDGALADFDRNLQFDAESALGFFYRGVIEHRQGSLSNALADYTRALKAISGQTNTLYARVYERRGALKMDQGDLDGAISDMSRAIEFDPDEAGYHIDRGVANYLDHHPSAAVADFQRAAGLNFIHADYPHIFIWLVKAEPADQLPGANQELKDYFLTRDGGTNDWPCQVGRFLTGEMSETDLLKAAGSGDPKTDKEQHCEAYFYAGVKHSLNGDVLAAKSCFRECIATEAKTFYEYRMAQIKLKALEEEK